MVLHKLQSALGPSNSQYTKRIMTSRDCCGISHERFHVCKSRGIEEHRRDDSLIRHRAGAGTKRGSPPRLRYLNVEVSTSKAVAKLPINAYDEAWYGKLRGLKKDDIAAKDPYDFTVDQSVIEYVSALALESGTDECFPSTIAPLLTTAQLSSVG